MNIRLFSLLLLSTYSANSFSMEPEKPFKTLKNLCIETLGGDDSIESNNPYDILNELLVVACEQGDLARVKFFCQNGANSNAVTEWGNSPLLACIRKNRIEIMKYLIEEQRADVKQRAWSNTPIKEALNVGNVEAIKILLANGISLESHNLSYYLSGALVRSNKQYIHFLIDNGANPETCTSSSDQSLYSLHWAAFYGDYDLLQKLLQKKVNINVTDKNNRNALYYATTSSQIEMAKFLIAQGIDINIVPTSVYNHWTPLFVAIFRNNLELTRILLQNGALVNICDTYGQSPLTRACAAGNIEIVKLLVACDADIDHLAPSCSSQTPLIAAIKNRHPHIAQFLIEQGANVSKKDDEYPLDYVNTAIETCIATNNQKLLEAFKIVKNLLIKGGTYLDFSKQIFFYREDLNN